MRATSASGQMSPDEARTRAPTRTSMDTPPFVEALSGRPDVHEHLFCREFFHITVVHITLTSEDGHGDAAPDPASRRSFHMKRAHSRAEVGLDGPSAAPSSRTLDRHRYMSRRAAATSLRALFVLLLAAPGRACSAQFSVVAECAIALHGAARIGGLRGRNSHAVAAIMTTSVEATW